MALLNIPTYFEFTTFHTFFILHNLGTHLNIAVHTIAKPECINVQGLCAALS